MLKDYRLTPGLDGALLMLTQASDLKHLRPHLSRILSYSNLATDLPVPRVVSDDYSVGVRAAEYYLSLGFSNFAFVSGKADHNYSIKRFSGFSDTLARSNFEVFDLNLQRGIIGQISKLPQPLAILAADDSDAAQIVNKLIAAEILVPEEVAVLGVNNDETLCALARVPLSSIGLSSQRIGFQAAKLLDRWIEHGEVPPPISLIGPEDVVERQSTRSYGVSDVVVAKAMQYIRNHAIGPVRVEEIARNCGVGRRTLERRFNELLERSPHEAVIEARIDAAKKMLVQTDFSMEDIASRSGFANKRQLSSTFRRVLNQTPSDYRRRHQLC
jgi:LacI family transcriptional regulator